MNDSLDKLFASIQRLVAENTRLREQNAELHGRVYRLTHPDPDPDEPKEARSENPLDPTS